MSIALQITWNGPYAWPTFEGQTGLQSIPKLSGLYLQTFEYKSGYIIYAAGLTRRPVPSRFKEHTQKYMNGEYNVLDINAAQQGIRKEIWHGWGYAKIQIFTHKIKGLVESDFILAAKIDKINL